MRSLATAEAGEAAGEEGGEEAAGAGDCAGEIAGEDAAAAVATAVSVHTQACQSGRNIEPGSNMPGFEEEKKLGMGIENSDVCK